MASLLCSSTEMLSSHDQAGHLVEILIHGTGSNLTEIKQVGSSSLTVRELEMTRGKRVSSDCTIGNLCLEGPVTS